MSATPESIACLRANYGLDTRNPNEAENYWSERCAGMAPAGAVAALGFALLELEALRKDAERLAFIHANLENDGFGWWLPEWVIKINGESDSPPNIDEFRAALNEKRKP